MKKYAFYLPQFHEIPENNKWWGDGFTEWTNVKKARPFFEGHVQPKHPLGDNYYNLLEKSTIEWQLALQKKYGIDGLVFYHYYFAGKKLLEKPAENLLKWKDVNQKFFFCWANHDWNKTWNGTHELLMKQVYGSREVWEEHFKYLLPFFKDNRYEKINNKPVFMIFNSYFPEKKEMFSYFEKRCKAEGFSGIYVIETFYWGIKWPLDYYKVILLKAKQTEKVLLREHSVGYYLSHSISWRLSYLRRMKKRINSKNVEVEIIDGNKACEAIIKKEPLKKHIMHSVNLTWDNTPRHKERGSVMIPPSKETFFRVMDHLKNEDMIIFNAWNEWAEGMVLEPTEEDGYKYLEWIKEWCDINQQLNISD